MNRQQSRKDRRKRQLNRPISPIEVLARLTH